MLCCMPSGCPTTTGCGEPAARRRPRGAAPTLSALTIAAIGLTVALRTPAPNRPAPPVAQPSPDPKTAATARIEAALRNAPMPPGAYPVRPLHLDVPGVGSGSPNEVRESEDWLAPGSPGQAIGYLVGHPPRGMTAQSGSSASGVFEVDFASSAPAAGYGTELDYVALDYHGAVAIEVVAWTVWVPDRPAWSYAPKTVTSADVTIVRHPYTRDSPGAPTVRRTLTGTAAQRLAAQLDRLPPQAPEGVHPCPPPLIEASETVVFHSPAGDLRVEHTFGGCALNAEITTAGHTAAPVLVKGTDVADAALRALGLPANYGYAR